MADAETQAIFLAKAAESLASATADHTAGRYNSCANRCYYACFQAAVAALISADITPRSVRGEWAHDYVRAQFEGLLIGRRKTYPAALLGDMQTLLAIRTTGDYDGKHVSRTQSERAMQRARLFVAAVQPQEQSL